MPPRDVTLRLQDIVAAIQKISAYTDGLDAQTFAQDERTLDAVLHNFVVIGEAARLVPAETEARHPELPWRRMRGLRNIVVHEYFRVDADIIWQTATDNLPPLLPLLEAILRAYEDTGTT